MESLDVLKEVGRRWRNISEPDLAIYKKEATRDRYRFKQERKLYLKAVEHKQQEQRREIEKQM